MPFYSTEERNTVLEKLSVIEHQAAIYLGTLERSKKKNHISEWAYNHLYKCLSSVRRGLDNGGNTFDLFLCVERAVQYINIARNRFRKAYYQDKFSLFYELLSALLPVGHSVQLKLFDTEKFVRYVDHHLEAAKNYLKNLHGKVGSYFNKSFHRNKQYKPRTYFHTPSVVQLELKLIF